jgi:hypothetical protein
LTGFGGSNHEIADHPLHLAVGTSHPIVSVEELGESGVMPVGVPSEHGVGLEHGLQPQGGILGPIPYLGEIREVAPDLTIVPGTQD